ncbi:hypothetical protein SAMN04487948_12811 [Halogranum amylolyticum]|uniref:MOSC domain-containing protein n=1 Tax=Halogranum amylolyticum TaxID=660520 RepID=A0A1H8WE75_9EURY|nr:MOSC N-terminal beta barrel domain-containing protein [Halogranum amylolyticum]SEP25869.1 hypothetical protein SAMN04487948_12811 [Halogranum amylolyticum]
MRTSTRRRTRPKTSNVSREGATATLRRITTFPVKSLDPQSLASVDVVENGGLAGDREFALVDADGEYVNGKRTAAIHRVRSSVDRERGTVTLRAPETESVTAPIDADSEALTDWLSRYFDDPVSLRRDRAGGFPDDTQASGPTVVSTATIRELASWYEGVDVESMRRRLRANLEVDGVPAFWEDRLFSDRDRRVAFEVGDVRLKGVNPCQRCVVPSRDPETGEAHPGFRETFVEKRRETMPDWSGGDWFDHHFRVMVNTVVPESEWGKTLSVGDEVRVLETVPNE